MKKLSLDLDDLQIESFSTTQRPATSPGTVRAYITLACESNSCDFCATLTDCGGSVNCGTHADPTCWPQLTCLPTCAGTTCQYETCGDCYTSNIC